MTEKYHFDGRIVCPWCGFEYVEVFKYVSAWTCPKCFEKFSVHYLTTRIPNEQEESASVATEEDFEKLVNLTHEIEKRQKEISELKKKIEISPNRDELRRKEIREGLVRDGFMDRIRDAVRNQEGNKS